MQLLCFGLIHVMHFCLVPNFLIQRLQYVLNSAARVIARSKKFDHSTPLLIELHWLHLK